MKLVINSCFGGFSLSQTACAMLGVDEWEGRNLLRNDARLIKIVEQLGEDANGMCAKLEIVEIPDTATDYHVEEYDGLETVIYVVDGKLHWSNNY